LGFAVSDGAGEIEESIEQREEGSCHATGLRSHGAILQNAVRREFVLRAGGLSPQ
jgi:hypothetical protein